MTDSNTSGETFAAGFKFMRQLRDQEFRAFVKQHGWEPGEHVVMASDEEPAIDVMARILLHETDGHATVAIPDDERKFGFRLMSISVGVPPRRWLHRRRIETVKLDPSASIGMLYAAFHRCGEYVPSEWSAPVTLRKEPEPV